MSLKNFQSVLANLYLQKSFREQFFSVPRKTLHDYDLTAREKQALTKIDRDKLSRFCQGLALKNSRWLRSCFRRTVSLLGERFFNALYQEYSDRHADLMGRSEKLEVFAALLFHVLSEKKGISAEALELARSEYIQAAKGLKRYRSTHAAGKRK